MPKIHQIWSHLSRRPSFPVSPAHPPTTSAKSSHAGRSQGDQIGRNFFHWAIVYSGQFLQ
jgi:hypothetical protein